MENKRFPYSIFGGRTSCGISKKQLYTDLLKLIIPAAIELILIQTVSMFDQIQVSGIGKYATNAVGMVNQIKLLFTTAFVSINVGVTALIARAKGREDEEAANRILRHGLLLILASSALCVLIASVFTRQILGLVGAPDEISFSNALVYFRICIISFIPAAVSSTITAALRGKGNTLVPCIYNTIANICNIFLNWVLINGKLGFPRLEVAGAAIATVISILLGFLISLWVLMTDRYGLRVRLKNLFRDLEWVVFYNIMRIGIPSMLEQMIVRIGLVLFTKVVSTLGTDMYAAHTICQNIQTLTYMNGMAFSIASTTMAGQCIGAGKNELAARYCQYCARMCCAFSLVLTVSYFFFGKNLIMLYNRDAAVVAMGIIPLRLMAIMQPLSALQYVFSGAIRGAGDVKYIAAVTITTTFLIRPTVAYLLVNFTPLGLVGAWIAMVVDQSICSLLLCLRFCSGKWQFAFEERKRVSET